MGSNDMNRSVTPWSELVTVTEIPETGTHYNLAADAETRAAVARAAGLRELPKLVAEFDVVPRGGAVAVRGEVKARVGQTCVVTLEPIESDVRETVDLLFAPATTEGEDTTHVLGDELPEPLAGDTIDLGAIATEFLILGLDPYPRKEGAEFSPPESGSDPAASPFAALGALKKRP